MLSIFRKNTNKYSDVIFESEVNILRNNYIPVLDWDVPNEGHKIEECVTFQSRTEIYKTIDFYAELFGLSIKVYNTPGGVRGWITSHQFSPRGLVTCMYKMQVDPVYQNMTRERNEWGARVSPKPNREGDYVAKFSHMVGDIIIPEAEEVIEYHDKLIKDNLS